MCVAVCEREIALRRAAGGAPFLRTAKLTIAAPTAIGAERRAKELAERLRERLTSTLLGGSLRRESAAA